MKKGFFKSALALLCLMLCFSSCYKKEEVFPSKELNNPELKQVLVGMGYKFEGNNLVMDDLVKKTRSLDLTETKLKDYSGLDIFPKLEEVSLVLNDLAMEFDFALLPENITQIDLQGNEIFEYNNLKGRKIKRLLLPNDAKYTRGELLEFYSENQEAVDKGEIDIRMLNKQGRLERYNSLREIPDDELRRVLKEDFSSVFVDEKIDLLNEPTLEEQQKNVIIAIDDMSKLRYMPKSLEGLEYILSFNNYTGDFYIIPKKEKFELKLRYVNIGNKINSIVIDNITIEKSFKTDNAIGLKRLGIRSVKGVTSLDLKKSDGLFIIDLGWTNNVNNFVLKDLPDLETIYFPIVKNNLTLSASIMNCPKIKELDFSKFDIVRTGVLKFDSFFLSKVPNAKITWPGASEYAKVINKMFIDSQIDSVKSGEMTMEELTDAVKYIILLDKTVDVEGLDNFLKLNEGLYKKEIF